MVVNTTAGRVVEVVDEKFGGMVGKMAVRWLIHRPIQLFDAIADTVILEMVYTMVDSMVDAVVEDLRQ